MRSRTEIDENRQKRIGTRKHPPTRKGFLLIMGKKVKARGRMRLLSIIGRFLFAWFFIFSGFKSLKEIWTDDKVKKEFTTMMVCIVRFQADTPESVILEFACYFVAVCASWKAIGGFLIMFDKIGGVFPLMLYLLITTLVRCLYYYKVGEPEFVVLLQGFMQNMTFFGALLLYLRMKIRIGRRQSKKKALKFKKT